MPLKKMKSTLVSKTETDTEESTQPDVIEYSLGVELTAKEVKTRVGSRFFDQPGYEILKRSIINHHFFIKNDHNKIRTSEV